MYTVGDKVRTTKQLFFVDAYNPETGESYETRFGRWDRLTVVGTDAENGTVTVALPNGFVAELAFDDVEA